MKILSTRAHGVLDYLTAVALFTLPRIFVWSDRVTLFLTIAAIGVLVYSLFTRYDLGFYGAIPLKVHLLLDLAVGAAFLVLAFQWIDEPDTVRRFLAAGGLFEIGTALLTRTQPHRTSLARRAQARSHP